MNVWTLNITMMSGLGQKPQIPDSRLDIQAALIFCLPGQVLLNLICFDLVSRQFARAFARQPSENEKLYYLTRVKSYLFRTTKQHFFLALGCADSSVHEWPDGSIAQINLVIGKAFMTGPLLTGKQQKWSNGTHSWAYSCTLKVIPLK